MRPEDWPECPCDNCEKKQVDIYGYLCDLSCGKRSAWINHEAGADAMFKAISKKVFIRPDIFSKYQNFATRLVGEE